MEPNQSERNNYEHKMIAQSKKASNQKAESEKKMLKASRQRIKTL